MCFKNLPVEFDELGRPFLREGWEGAYVTDTGKSIVGHGSPPVLSNEKVQKLLADNANVHEFNVDPVTRVAGALAFHSVADLQERKMVETRSMATLFRGYEIILQGRDPRDAIFISSRACGVCGGVHSTCSALAMEMAFNIQPPPLGVLVRNMMLSMEFLYDHPLHLFLLAGPDYSENVVKSTNRRSGRKR